MKKEKSKVVGSWAELCKFVEGINPYKKTIIMTGYVNKLFGEKTAINKLVFETRNVNILREKNDKKQRTKKRIPNSS